MSDYLVFAGYEPHRRYGDEHFLVVGASGSGKTELLKHLMQSALSDCTSRAIVYDPKQEVVPFLYGIRGLEHHPEGIYSQVKILHPFDARSCAWDMAQDIDSPVAARQLATLLIPDEGDGKDGFFINATRDILTGVVLAFIECVPSPKAWTFRDVILAMLYEPYQRLVLDLATTRDGRPFPQLQRVRESYFGEGADPRTLGNIRASIAAKLAIYEPIAAVWHRAEESGNPLARFCLREWLSSDRLLGSDILVLGNDEAARAAMDAINRAIFKRTTEMVLARPERSARDKEAGENQTWFFLDEVREAGELDGLSRLLTKGRSKGTCVALGFQDIDGLRDVYGEGVANEICAQCNNVAVMRLNSPATADWASDLFGRRLEVARSSGHDIGAQGMSMSRGTSEEERPFLYTDAFLYAPLASAVRYVGGFRKGPDMKVGGKTRDEVVAEFEFKETELAAVRPVEELARDLRRQDPSLTLTRATGLLAPFISRPVSEQYLLPWGQDDFDRLGLKMEVPSWRSVASAKAEAAKKTGARLKGWLPGSKGDRGAAPEAG